MTRNIMKRKVMAPDNMRKRYCVYTGAGPLHWLSCIIGCSQCCLLWTFVGVAKCKSVALGARLVIYQRLSTY